MADDLFEVTPPAQSVSDGGDGSGYVGFAVLLVLAAAGFTLGGLNTMYSYDTETGQIVGGDAYNYIIIATRGVGLIAAGIACAVLACTFCVLAARAQFRRRIEGF
jgi:hypothetical protein